MKTAISILSLLIALLVAGFGYLEYEKNKQTNVDVKNTLNHIEAQLAQLKTETNNTQTHLTGLQEKYLSLKLDENWRIAEASHLLRLAALELQVSRDITTSMRLLEAADSQLSNIQDPKLLPVREWIAKEKSALQKIKLPDLEKLWLQVGILIDQIPTLPSRGIRSGKQAEKINEKQVTDNISLKEPNLLIDLNEEPGTVALIETATAATTEETAKTDKPNSNWKQGLQSSWQEFKDLIKIQHHSKAIEPILKESEQALARENLLLIFEQLRWAILHSNNTVYQHSIVEAKKWITQYFEVNNSHTEQMQASLDELAKIDLRPVLPDIGQALQTLQNKG